ncbi:MAG: hypothetical protein H0U66_04855 [Gemmatimonadaceae bacterium]|nr:hypothetical protein [Gemmatimonadaceae bacterium]
MFRKISAVMFALVLVAGLGNSAQAQHRRGMVLLGERHIDGRVDSDKIDIGRDNGTFRAIQFRVQGGDVRFEKIQIKYLNGEREDIDVRSDIRSGGRTRIIDLPGNRRVIESISMWYSKGEWRTRPQVRVYGVR